MRAALLALLALTAVAQEPGRFPDVRKPAGPLPVDRPLQAGIVIVDGVFNTELIAPYDVLEHVQYALEGGAGIRVATISPDGAAVTSAEGLRIEADFSFADAPELDILVVPSAEDSTDDDLENQALLAFVKERGGRARIVLSLCWGAFVLAEAGLLDGHLATSFPHSNAVFASRYEEITVLTGPTFVHHGRFVTSQGGVPSYEAALYVVDHLYGEEIAERVGGGLVVSWPPPDYPSAGMVVVE